MRRCDDDDDDDGTVDIADAFPFDASADTDTDGDGMPNVVVGTSTSTPALVEDLDDDNDGWSDLDEKYRGTSPLVDTLKPVDSDGDGSCDSVSTDDDGDGVSDEEGALRKRPATPTASRPTWTPTASATRSTRKPTVTASTTTRKSCATATRWTPRARRPTLTATACVTHWTTMKTATASAMPTTFTRDPSKHEDVPGCIDENAFNFDAAANLDDGSCFDLEPLKPPMKRPWPASSRANQPPQTCA